MNTRIALVAGFVSLLVTTAGCARGPVGPSPARSWRTRSRPTRRPGRQPGGSNRSARFDQAPTPPRVVDPGRMLQPFASLSAR